MERNPTAQGRKLRLPLQNLLPVQILHLVATKQGFAITRFQLFGTFLHFACPSSWVFTAVSFVTASYSGVKGGPAPTVRHPHAELAPVWLLKELGRENGAVGGRICPRSLRKGTEELQKWLLIHIPRWGWFSGSLCRQGLHSAWVTPSSLPPCTHLQI